MGNDLIIVGGGLAGLLTAWRCLKTANASQVTIIEQAPDIAGSHTWSFNRTDISHEAWNWLQPMITHRWPAYHVNFPAYSRKLDLQYVSTNSDSLRAALVPLITTGKLILRTGTKPRSMTPTKVTLETGETLTGTAVIDATGFTPSPHRQLGYQKFVGHVVRTTKPHGLANPIIMDATVAQDGGYRFVYSLPFSVDTVLIEDTYYEDGPTLSENLLATRINDYAMLKGWQISETLHREKGVLPITLASNINRQLTSETGPPKIGMAGGLYHAVTGYSFPDAVRMAEAIGALYEITPENIANIISKYRRNHWKRERFFRLLCRMLFKAGEPENRYKVLQRFYRLSPGLVSNFYNGDLTAVQKVRLLSGKPPVPIGRAIHNLLETPFMKRNQTS